MLNVINS